MKQGVLRGMPSVDYEHVLAKDRALRRRRAPVALPPGDDIFTAAGTLSSPPQEAAIELPRQPEEAAVLPAVTQERQRSPLNRTEKLHRLREALAPYLDFPTVRRLAAQGEDLTQAYIGTGEMPPEVHAVLDARALMLLATLLSLITVYVGRLMTSLLMHPHDFSPSTVASTAVVGGLVTIPINGVIGILSDRLGHRRLLIVSYVLAAGGVVLLSMAGQLWHFWLETALLFVATAANGSVATALATDVLPRDALRRGMSWLNGMTWVAGIIGFAGTGYLTDTLGVAATCLIAAVVAIAAAGLLARRQCLVAETVSLDWRSIILALFSQARKKLVPDSSR
jgi:hypothetical protein